jgi:hypothetical protein
MSAPRNGTTAAIHISLPFAASGSVQRLAGIADKRLNEHRRTMRLVPRRVKVATVD